MPSVEYLKQFVREKLAAAAEEIFVVFHNTIVEYEEELDRQRKMFDVAWTPVVKIHRTELPQQSIFKEELIVTDQSSLDQDRISSLDQEKLEPPQAEEQQEEVISSELRPKQELQDLLICSAEEMNDGSENPTADWNPEEPLHESEVNIPVITSVVSEANNDLSLDTDVSQDGNTLVPKSNDLLTNSGHCKKMKHKSKAPFVCPACGKRFRCRSHLNRHHRVHTGEKPYVCQTCGKGFSQTSTLNQHQKVHTGEKSFVCQTCGKQFSRKACLTEHQRVHTDERPFVCQTCGKDFRHKISLKYHEKTTTCEKPDVCQMWSV